MTSKDKRKTARARALYDQKPIEHATARQQREQRRRFAAQVCQLPLLQVDDDLAEQVVAFALACKAHILARTRRANKHPGYYDYLQLYLGLSGTCLDSEQIAVVLETAPTTVRNNLIALYQQLHILLQNDPALTALVAQRQAAHAHDDAAFWARGQRNEASGCLLWAGATDLGYGVLKRNGKKLQAHRYAFSLAHRPIAPGMHVAHTCGVRRCIAPEHLIEVAPGEGNA